MPRCKLHQTQEEQVLPPSCIISEMSEPRSRAHSQFTCPCVVWSGHAELDSLVPLSMWALLFQSLLTPHPAHIIVMD